MIKVELDGNVIRKPVFLELKTDSPNFEMPIPIEASLVHGVYDKDVRVYIGQIAPGFILDGCDLCYNSNRLMFLCL